MSLWRQIRSGLLVLINRKAANQDAAEEVSHYLEEATAEWLAKGLPAEEARRAAQRETGSNELVIREQIRDYGWENAIGNFLDDVRFAGRRLRLSLRFTLISVCTLAFGIGATSFMFSVIDGTLLKPLAYPESERIVALRHSAPGLHIDDMNIAASLYFTYKEESRVFQDVALWVPDTSNITGLAQPEQVHNLLVTNRFLSVLGVMPTLGRAFTASDDDPSSQPTVILADGYWKSRFAGDPAVLGRRILIDGKPNEIVGVLPSAFQFMDDRPISFLAPLRIRRSDVRLVSFCCQGIARMKPGTTVAQANADVARMLPMAAAKFPMNPGMLADSYSAAHFKPRVRSLKDVVVGNVGKALWLVMITVTIVLVIACANVANLLLVRANGRQQDLAVRAALGAGWGRIARELLLESLLLSLAGGALGLALAYAAVRVLAASDMALLPRIHEIAIDPSALAFTFATSLVVGMLFGLVPVLRYGRPLPSSALRGQSRSFSASKDRHQVRNLLVVVQVALALLLLVGSGLMIRTFRALHHVDPGFSNAREVETMRVAIPEREVPDPEKVTRVEEQILHKIESLPFVSRAALISDLPMEGGENEVTYAKDMPSVQASGALLPVRRYKYVSPGYFATSGARLIVGRDFTWTEVYQQTPVALISEGLAREWWGDPRKALGKQIREGFKDDWREVVGVVADLHDDGIDQQAPTIVYWPLLVKNFGSSSLEGTRNAALLIRTRQAGSAALFSQIQGAVAAVNSNLPVADARTLDSIYSTSLARTKITLVLLMGAGTMALFLGVIGIYGVISYSVSQRTREIGIRLALGCPRSQVISLFMRDGLLLSGIGSACGMIAAIGLTRLMSTLLFEVGPGDPLTYVAASSVMIFTAIIANFLPARRAALVNPMRALRAE